MYIESSKWLVKLSNFIHIPNWQCITKINRILNRISQFPVVSTIRLSYNQLQIISKHEERKLLLTRAKFPNKNFESYKETWEMCLKLLVEPR